MDRKLLENILNDFPNIQNDEEFYRDISGIMEPIETGEFVYTDLSYADFLKSKGILKLNKIPKPNQTEIEIKDKALALSLGKYIVINKDLMEEEVDLDNKIIRLNSLHDNPDITVGNVSPFEGSLEDLRKHTIDLEGQGDEDTGDLYSVHIHKHPEGNYTYHWMKPLPSDIFLMPRLDVSKRKGPVKRLVSHPRAVQHSGIIKDPALRASSQLTPEEVEHYLYAGFSNLGSTLKVDETSKSDGPSDATSPHRLFFPVKPSHPIGGYIRINRPFQETPTHFQWKHDSDHDTILRAMAAAEKLYERVTGQVRHLGLNDVKDFIEKYTDNPAKEKLAAIYAGDKPSAKESRKQIEEIKKEPIFSISSDPEAVHPTEYHEKIAKLLSGLMSVQNDPKATNKLKSPAELFDPAYLRNFFNLKGKDTYKQAIRTLEKGGTKENSPYMKAISKLSKIHTIGERTDSAINHLTSHIEDQVLPICKINLEDKIKEGDPQKIASVKQEHDNVVLTYLSRFLGTRLGGGGDDKEETSSKHTGVGLSSLTRRNVVLDKLDPENGPIKLVFIGKGDSLADITIEDPYLKSLIMDQLNYVDEISKQQGKSLSPDDRLFSTGPDFYQQAILKKGPLHDIVTKLELQKITGYNFRHYRGTEVAIKGAQEEARKKVRDILNTELRTLPSQERMSKIRQIAGNIERMVSELDLNGSRILEQINYALSHSPGSTSWSNYASPKFIKAAYRVALKKYLTLLYNEAKNDKS